MNEEFFGGAVLSKLIEYIISLADAINSVPKLIEALMSLRDTPYSWLILFAILSWFAINKDMLFFVKLKEKKERQRIDEMERYLEKKDIADKATLKVLNDLRACRYFKIATGIYAEQRKRVALLHLHDRTSIHINWQTIKLADRFFKYDDKGEIYIAAPTISQKLGKFFNEIIGWFMLLLSAASLFMIGATSRSIESVLLQSFFSAVFMLMAAFSFIQNNPLNAAIKVRNEMVKPEAEKAGVIAKIKNFYNKLKNIDRLDFFKKTDKQSLLEEKKSMKDLMVKQPHRKQRR